MIKLKLNELLEVMDFDTRIHIEAGNKERFDGIRGEFNADPTYALSKHIVKAVWYSKIYNAIMIEL